MAPPATLYVIASHTWDVEHENEGIREPEVYSTKQAANEGARKLMRRYAELLNPLGDPDEFTFHHNLDDEGLYRGTMDAGPYSSLAAEIHVYKVILNKPGTRNTVKLPIEGKGNWPEVKVEDADVQVEEVEVKDETDHDGDGGGGGDDDDEEDEIEEEPPKTKRSTTRSKSSITKPTVKHNVTRKKIPSGIPNCLKCVKLLFTGTFEAMDRVTSIATANKYGAEVVTKLEDTDYIVLGLRAGHKKLQVINELELETINEDEFFDILRHGVSKDKRQRMANKRKADEEEAPEEEEEEEVKKPRTSGRNKRARR